MRQEKKGGKIIKKIWENINKYQDDWYKFNQINNQSKYKWLNNSLERQRFSHGIENQDPTIYDS